MALSPITEEYYLVLEVRQTATPELIITTYERLALKLHADGNAKDDATAAFQLVCQPFEAKPILPIMESSVLNHTLKLGRAYETLKDEAKRRAYNLIYPSIRRGTLQDSSTLEICSPPNGL
ncbi:hypothetical protein BDV96DRAFT_566173 [Lophiotrema nucula]|uniref:J domain-containing protein n=1 Tax=Lophiotrema nucula TaxID=690887 RepID=A0A6A5ZLX4_9PLEO|nr:hypothetical protein BDV96DRAFT_566173 [Lophiotrema nucula]